jgi:hypothetical protein
MAHRRVRHAAVAIARAVMVATAKQQRVVDGSLTSKIDALAKAGKMLGAYEGRSARDPIRRQRCRPWRSD